MLPKKPGSYILLLKCVQPEKIQIGAKGILTTRKGYYLYCGSAFGPGGLTARVGRHLRNSKKNRWHIDYLRERLQIIEIWYSTHFKSLEHQCAEVFLSNIEMTIPQIGFGSSDCDCKTHLFFSLKKPSYSNFLHQIGAIDFKRIVV